MPLEIAYRPIILPPALAGRGDASAVVAEPAPVDTRGRDFVARIRRRDMASLRRVLHRPRRMRQRIGGIIAIGLLPAVLATTGWGDPRGIVRAAARDGVPGETGHGWGSAIAAIHSDAEEPNLAATIAGPAARPLLLAGSGLDRWRALQCLTTAIYYEAAREPDAGQRAVAQVVLNRVAHPAFPKTVCGVVYQGSERPGCQFSFACDGSLAHAPMAQWWDRARRVAEIALAGQVFTPIGLATHYHTSAVHPAWADSMRYLGTIGAHRFYSWTGGAGQPQAFSAVYTGGEPIAAPHPHSWVSTGADLADPLALEKAFEAGRMAALRTTAPAEQAAAYIAQPQPAPAHPAAPGQPPLPQATAAAQDRVMPESGGVRPDAQAQYDGAAHWIRQPGT
jgi:hypothetical protein